MKLTQSTKVNQQNLEEALRKMGCEIVESNLHGIIVKKGSKFFAVMTDEFRVYRVQPNPNPDHEFFGGKAGKSFATVRNYINSVAK